MQTSVRDPGGGFTISEKVRAPRRARDFERAVRMLEQEQHEEGIALLVQVTEAAPNLTAAHIDLGIARAPGSAIWSAPRAVSRKLGR